jgi:hypothetical protein
MCATASQEPELRNLESFPTATIGVLKETHPRERRVAVTPGLVPRLTNGQSTRSVGPMAALA